MLCPICKKELSCVISMYSCKECNLFCNRETIDILAQSQKDHKKPGSTTIALRQKIAVLELNNNFLRQKCEEYLGKLAVAKQALEKYADEDMWETGHRWEVDYIQALFLEHGYEIAKEALEQINRKED